MIELTAQQLMQWAALVLLADLGYQDAEPPAPFRLVWGLYVALLLCGVGLGCIYSFLGRDKEAFEGGALCGIAASCYLLGGFGNRVRWFLWWRRQQRELVVRGDALPRAEKAARS